VRLRPRLGSCSGAAVSVRAPRALAVAAWTRTALAGTYGHHFGGRTYRLRLFKAVTGQIFGPVYHFFVQDSQIGDLNVSPCQYQNVSTGNSHGPRNLAWETLSIPLGRKEQGKKCEKGREEGKGAMSNKIN